MFAALFIERDGVYAQCKSADLWDVTRDARLYRGKHRVIAHPPCARWGRFWPGNPSRPEFQLGEDDGCFAAALWAVRSFGGVIEHPAGSQAWPWFGLPEAAPLFGSWGDRDRYGGRTCRVAQGHYGHPCPKYTWLYAVLDRFPELRWGESDAPGRVEKQSRKQRLQTPVEFRDTLISMVDDTPVAGDTVK